MWSQILTGVLAGAAYSFLGWVKENKKDTAILDKVNAEFKISKLVISAISCGVVGGIASYTNGDFNLLITGSMGIGVTKLVNLLYKIVAPKVKKLFL